MNNGVVVKAGPEALPEHAGFLMALGLSGHLSCLAEPNACDYLSRSHEMTSIGILLGTAATKRGQSEFALKSKCILLIFLNCNPGSTCNYIYIYNM